MVFTDYHEVGKISWVMLFFMKSEKFDGLWFLKCVRISIRGLVCRLVGRSVGWLVSMLLSKLMKNGLLWILNDLDSAGRGRKRDEEEGGTRRKEGQGGRRDGEERGTSRVKKKNFK